MDESIKAYSIRRPRTAFVAGALIGTLGGLIGLGGAEFRLPVLIALFALLPHRAVRFNLLVSLVTLAFSCLTRLRLQTGLDAALYVDVAASMIVGGMIAAWFGAGLLSRIPTDRLMSTIAVLLLAIAALLVAEATHLIAAPFELPHDTVVRVSAGLMAGILVGAISSLLGVAGGEFIIPILIFIFGADIKTAGALSILISLPIVAIGVSKHRISGHYRSRDVLVHLVWPMGLGSVVGAVIGGYGTSFAPTDGLKVVLAVILTASAYKLSHKVRR